MNEENRITLILIDTCAFRDANSDFPGIVKSLLPSFFSTADEKGITLLTHPVLENEIHMLKYLMRRTQFGIALTENISIWHMLI